MTVRMHELKKFLSFRGRGSCLTPEFLPYALDLLSMPMLDGLSLSRGAIDGLPACLTPCLGSCCLPFLPARLGLLLSCAGLKAPRVCRLLIITMCPLMHIESEVVEGGGKDARRAPRQARYASFDDAIGRDGYRKVIHTLRFMPLLRTK